MHGSPSVSIDEYGELLGGGEPVGVGDEVSDLGPIDVAGVEVDPHVAVMGHVRRQEELHGIGRHSLHPKGWPQGTNNETLGDSSYRHCSL